MNQGPEAATGLALRRFLRSLIGGRLLIAVSAAFAVAVLVNPLFQTRFPLLLGRTLLVSMALLLAFVAAQQVRERWLPAWLPRWLLTVLAVGMAAPLGTLVVYLLVVRGNVPELLGNPGMMAGFAIIASAALVVGMLVTLAAQVREREALARALALEFELERSRLAKQAVDTRLAVLQAQIEPHFLFNTLANVQALVEAGSPRAPAVLQSLIAYLRAAMPRLHGDGHTLAAELDLVHAYLALMQMRMPDRLQYRVEVDAALNLQPFPAMALLTLVENAVRHGIDPSEDGGHIHIGGHQDSTGCCVWVSDSGLGMADDATPGTGLTNLRARVHAFFGPGAELRLTEQRPHGLRAELAWQPESRVGAGHDPTAGA